MRFVVTLIKVLKKMPFQVPVFFTGFNLGGVGVELSPLCYGVSSSHFVELGRENQDKLLGSYRNLILPALNSVGLPCRGL